MMEINRLKSEIQSEKEQQFFYQKKSRETEERLEKTRNDTTREI